jgi:MGT family glycosyltransferase
MAVVLAYTAPAIGHLFPFCALLDELSARGHAVHVRTLASGVELCRSRGFEAEPVDSRIEALQSEDDSSDGVLRSVGRTVRTLTDRAALEVADLDGALRSVDPDVVIVDTNCWGAMSVLEAQSRPWLVLSPFTPYLRSAGSPPFGAGAAPWRGPVGRIRDLGIGSVNRLVFDRPFRAGMDPVRAALGLPAVRTADELLRRAPAVLVTTGKPFEYPHTDWGHSVELIGPADFDPPPRSRPSWLDDIDAPIVLVTTSSVPQADEALVNAVIDAVDGTAVHVVATCPVGGPDHVVRPGVTMARFVPHSLILDRAVCVVTHGGMGVTQKALARGIPVCVVPFGRDQFEVARRVEVARCGTRLPARRLSVPRLRGAIESAMTMSAGAAQVAAGFAATGGVRRGATVVEQQLSGEQTRNPLNPGG